MKSYFSIILYIVSGVLLCFYVYVLWLGAHPDVTYEYRGFYIDHRFSYMPPEGALAAKPGVRLFLDGRDDSDSTFYGLGREWTWEYKGKAMENTGYCRIENGEGRLYFTGIDSSIPHRVRLHTAQGNSADHLEASAGGQDLGPCDIDEEDTIVIEIPAGDSITAEIPGGGNELELTLVTEPGDVLAVDYLVFE